MSFVQKQMSVLSDRLCKGSPIAPTSHRRICFRHGLSDTIVKQLCKFSIPEKDVDAKSLANQSAYRPPVPVAPRAARRIDGGTADASHAKATGYGAADGSRCHFAKNTVLGNWRR